MALLGIVVDRWKGTCWARRVHPHLPDNENFNYLQTDGTAIRTYVRSKKIVFSALYKTTSCRVFAQTKEFRETSKSTIYPVVRRNEQREKEKTESSISLSFSLSAIIIEYTFVISNLFASPQQDIIVRYLSFPIFHVKMQTSVSRRRKGPSFKGSSLVLNMLEIRCYKREIPEIRRINGPT